MAIYSLRMSAVGKTTQKQPFTAAAHIKYITRKEAVTAVLSARMPGVRRQAIAWMKKEERDDRKNARIIDKIVVALPRELSSIAQQALVTAFAEELTRGRASWLAAFHTKGKDRNNPHCHIVLRDRDIESGRRVMFLSAGKKEAAQKAAKGEKAPTTLQAVRELWERCANAALKVAGRTERIDRRTLKEQGVGRLAQVHEGPNIRAMHQRGVRPVSRDRVVKASPFGRRGRSEKRLVRYAEIDRGVTRVEFNAALKQPSRVEAEQARNRSVVNAASLTTGIGARAHQAESDTRSNRQWGHGNSAPSLKGPPVQAHHVHAAHRPVPVPPPRTEGTIPASVNQDADAFERARSVMKSAPSLTEILAQQHGISEARPNAPADRSRSRVG